MPEWTLPIRIESEANISEHWAVRRKRHKKYEKQLLKIKKEVMKCKLPCEITLIRIAPRMLDFDNLCFSQKHISDTICSFLIPNLAPGRADGSKEIKIQYEQKKGLPKEYALEIRINSSKL
jgi:hypothetical protein